MLMVPWSKIKLKITSWWTWQDKKLYLVDEESEIEFVRDKLPVADVEEMAEIKWHEIRYKYILKSAKSVNINGDLETINTLPRQCKKVNKNLHEVYYKKNF